MFSILWQTAIGILNSLICVVHFSNHFNSVFRKKVPESYWCSSSIACQDNATNWILRISTFNDKNPLNLHIISKLEFFWASKWSRSNAINHKTIWHIPNIKNSEFKLKKCQVFPNPLLFFLYFFRQYLT